MVGLGAGETCFRTSELGTSARGAGVLGSLILGFGVY